jgi:hypothetical protein
MDNAVIYNFPIIMWFFLLVKTIGFQKFRTIFEPTLFQNINYHTQSFSKKYFFLIFEFPTK